LAPITGLVGYSATGGLPLGTGAPDVVAFRVKSGDPDTADLVDLSRRWMVVHELGPRTLFLLR
jgi:hypothetical protein